MCGAYEFSADNAEKVQERFEAMNALENYKPRYNLRPGEMNPVVIMQEDYELRYMFWTLIPHWAPDKRAKFSTLNARSDRILDSKIYREPLLKRRCLIPANGFYEPDKIHYPTPPYPWHYFRRKDHGIFSFAGIYDVWREKERVNGKWVIKENGTTIYSYSLITLEPNTIVGAWHDRMPAMFLTREAEKEWLDPDRTEPEHIMSLLKQYPDNELVQWQVGDAAKNPRNDYPELTQPLQN